jgi:hypothetical protein
LDVAKDVKSFLLFILDGMKKDLRELAFRPLYSLEREE